MLRLLQRRAPGCLPLHLTSAKLSTFSFSTFSFTTELALCQVHLPTIAHAQCDEQTGQSLGGENPFIVIVAKSSMHGIPTTR